MTEKPKFTVGGVEIFLSKSDVEQKLLTVEPENIREVSVLVNGKRYPVKQALAESTGLLRGNLTSHDAMRVFRKLALPVGTGPGEDVLMAPERFFTVVKSLNLFDQKEVRGVVGGLLSKTDRDDCFVGIYYRAKANVESLLSLKYLAACGKSLDSEQESIGVSTGSVCRIRAWQWAHASSAADKRTCGFLTRSWRPLRVTRSISG